MTNNKDFYFKLFAREYLTDPDIRAISLEAQGIVIRLWCVCCLEGFLPADPEDLSIASGIKQSYLRSYQREWQRFFREGSDGRLFSSRMEKERERRIRVQEGASKAGKISADKKKKLSGEL